MVLVDGTPATNLDVILGSDMYPGYSSTFAGAELEDVSAYTLPGWQLYRRVLKPTELAAVRGKTLLLALRLNDDLDTGENLTFRIDDVQVVAADARTAAVPLPAALRGNGTRPIAYIRSDPGNAFSGRLWRMDTDGQNAGQIYAGQLSDVAAPAWSRSGAQIAVIDGNTWPAGETDPNKYVPASALRVVNADGSNLRTVTQTGGKPGSSCPVPPGTTQIADLIVELTGLNWAPDDRSIVAANVSYLRYCNNSIDGGVAQVESVPAAGGAGSMILNYATSPRVSREGRIVFEAYDLQGGFRNESIWLYDAAAQPIEQLLLANKSFDSDGDPVWLPDGRHFVTIRPTISYRVDPGGSTARNQAIMLFDRQGLGNPRMLLLADHGSISNLAVSPDGAYLLYTLRTVEGNAAKNNIWWLNVADGATGPVTSDGLSSQADWRQSAGSAALPRRVSIPLVLR